MSRSAKIVIADATHRYAGPDAATRPLGGTEMSVIRLAEALARRGHDVTCYTNTDTRLVQNYVTWIPRSAGGPESCTVYVAVQQPELLGFVRRPRRRVLWLVWPPAMLRRPRKLPRMWWYRPFVVFVSEYQAAVYPAGLPSTRSAPIIPLGLPDGVRGSAPRDSPPAPRAIFASNPRRNLRWLIELWSREILPRVPDAELHIHGLRDYSYRYGDLWEETHQRLGQFLPPGLPPAARESLKPHPPGPQEELWDAMRLSRVILYGGHRSEAFCLALAEAQALGVPAVVKRVAVLPERVRDGVTGFVADDDGSFARHAAALLTDDSLWRRQHEAALRLQQGWTWDEVAENFDDVVVAPVTRARSRSSAGLHAGG